MWLFLRANGIDARLDLPASEERRDWPQWMTEQVQDADRILVIASPGYKLRAEGDAAPEQGRGVQWEAWLIRERFYADQRAGLRLVLPVVLAGCSAADIPLWLGPAAATHYVVSEFTVAGAEMLLRALTGQPGETEPPIGAVPSLPARGTGTATGAARPALRTEVLIDARMTGDGQVASAVTLGGSPLCQRQAPLPVEVAAVWGALRLPPLAAAERMADAGRRLAGMLFDEDAQRLLAGVADRLPPGDTIEVVLSAAAPLLSLPVELTRLTTGGGEVGPLGLQPGVSVYRRPSAAGRGEDDRAPGGPLPVPGLAGPLKILAAVAAPDETKTQNVPLDVEAEMQAVLDAVSALPGGPAAQVRILEVASLAQIRQALRGDVYHVLHLSAHGSAESAELEDEDGRPVPVTAEALMGALRQAGRPVPLIVLSSCSGGSAATETIAAGLVERGADRVIAMLAPVTDGYATMLARRLYQELAARPGLPVGQALATARGLAEEDRSRAAGDRLPLPEYGVATLLAAGADGPLVDTTAVPAPLTVATVPAGGRSVRELPVGALIGRRAQLRTAMGVLRRTDPAEREFGAASGVVLTGIGGIGKTALAGRVISRLREDGWLIAVHEGRWNPTALIIAIATALTDALPRITGTAAAASLRQAGSLLSDRGLDDRPKLAVVGGLLAERRLLVVLDDFEQNLTPGGQEFLDPAISEVLDALADAAQTGGLLITCRYQLPGPDRFLVRVPVPGLSAAELRRMFLRLPAIADLDPADQLLLIRAIGGHPRLIEFTDALLRGGRSSLRHVQVKLRDLARAEGVDLAWEPPVGRAVDQAMVLGSADILLAELLGLLTVRQAAILAQIAVCRAPMTLDDLAFTLTPGPDPDSTGLQAAASPQELAGLRADTGRLADLTLIAAGEDIVMHPWTAALVTRQTPADPDVLHERALAMRWRRFAQQRGSYQDLLDIARHLAALGRWDDIADVAGQAVRVLSGTLATVACLAEIRPLIPPAERAWTVVADLEVQALLRAGDLPGATRQLQAIHEQVEARAAADPANTRWQRDLSISHERLGDVAVAAGDLAAARAAYQASLDIRQRLAAADPANTEWQRDLSISHERLGNVAVAAGDLAAARAAHQASLDIAVRLAAADPANTGWQRDLSISHNKLGDVAMAAGDLAAARAAYQASLDIRQRLAAADPANTEWQRDLSISHEKLGDVAMAAGDLAAARAAYQASLDIRQRLAAADPANTGWQRDLSISHEQARGHRDGGRGPGRRPRRPPGQPRHRGAAGRRRPRQHRVAAGPVDQPHKLGDVAVAAGDLAAARAAHQASLDIRQRLAAADPANTEWQRDLSISHEKLGDIAVAAGDLAAARAAHQASLDIRQRLAAADPANTGWQRDLSISHEKLGNIAMAAGDLAAARAAYQASLDIAVRLAAADPANTGWQRDLSISHDKLGDVAVAAGDLAAARAAHQASLDIRQRLAAADPANTGWQRDLSISHDKLGDVAVAAGDLAAARAAHQASLDIRQRLAAADPANTGWQRDLSISHEKLGDIAVAAGDLAAARAAHQASLDIRQRLAAADPANTGWQRDLSITRQKIEDLGNSAEEV